MNRVIKDAIELGAVTEEEDPTYSLADLALKYAAGLSDPTGLGRKFNCEVHR